MNACLTCIVLFSEPLLIIFTIRRHYLLSLFYKKSAVRSTIKELCSFPVYCLKFQLPLQYYIPSALSSSGIYFRSYFVFLFTSQWFLLQNLHILPKICNQFCHAQKVSSLTCQLIILSVFLVYILYCSNLPRTPYNLSVDRRNSTMSIKKKEVFEPPLIVFLVPHSPYVTSFTRYY